MAYTLANLQDDIRNYTEVGSNVLSDSVLSRLIKNAELKIHRAIDTDQSVYYATSNLIIGNRYVTIPDVDSRGDLNRATGFTIQLGQIDSAGNVTGATTTDPLTDPINYFYVSLGLSVAGTVGGVSGGGSNCSAGPVTLEVVNG